MGSTKKRQHGVPLYIKSLEASGISYPLQEISLTGKHENQYNEGWLQDFLFNAPDVFPVTEIDPIFGPLIPVCTELSTKAGPADILYVNPDGLLTLVECKLWRNPEARREVVGQTLDYAKELSHWSYEDLQTAVQRRTQKSLYDIVKQFDDKIEEAVFIDNVSRNLQRGRFLLLIAGDGIREGVENITNFLQAYSGLHFTFALVEFGVFKLPDASEEGWIIQSRILARTEEIERAVIRVDHGALTVEQPEYQVVTHSNIGQRKPLTSQEFFDAIKEIDPESAIQLPGFFNE